ncbi:MAG: exonuclease SbcCD subunit D [Maioricimonas sp. JB049]
MRYLVAAKNYLTRLTNGGSRPVVVVAGNHDAPRSRKDLCFLELYRDIPGVHIVTAGYEAVDLGDLVVHALPHDSLKSVDFDTVRPTRGKVNVLTSHGVAESSELFLRALGREFAIPGTVMYRDWDYVALGHWHKRGPVYLGGEGGGDSRIWYSGSTENISFRDLRDDDGMRRGWLAVELDGDGTMPRVAEQDVAIRPMFRLPDLDATGMEPATIRDEMIRRIVEAEISGAVVGQRVKGVSRDVWALCDLQMVQRAAHNALHYQVWAKTANVVDTEVRALEGGQGEVEALLGEIVDDTVEENLRQPVLEKASGLLADAAGDVSVDETKDAA